MIAFKLTLFYRWPLYHRFQWFLTLIGMTHLIQSTSRQELFKLHPKFRVPASSVRIRFWPGQKNPKLLYLQTSLVLPLDLDEAPGLGNRPQKLGCPKTGLQNQRLSVFLANFHHFSFLFCQNFWHFFGTLFWRTDETSQNLVVATWYFFGGN